ncbi:uncharacterized protein [Macrobrachium rosenbergii]|uniref:uncharacterized protein n=1 Tax=Macrobrachium rosenbergii TaxID=79674 RepID=UPI0034D74ED1
MDDCFSYTCLNGNWVETNDPDPQCCSDIYYRLQYDTISTLGGDTFSETTSGETVMTTPEEMIMFSSTSSTEGILLARSRRGIYWENIYYYSFPWWYDNNGNTSLYESYTENQNELNKDNLALNGITYTGSCEKLVCIGRDHINRTGEIHPRCCFYNGDWYHHGHPMYMNNCKAQVCSEGSWVEVDHWDPYCCSNIYYELQYGTISTLGWDTYTETTSGENITTKPQEMNSFSSISSTGGMPLPRSRRGIYWENMYNYDFPWWYDNNGNTSWYEEYSENQNELKKDNLALNGIAYTGSCEKLVCIGRDHINRTGEIHPKCCFYNGDWYHHGYPMYLNNCKAQVCSEGSWVEVDHLDPYCCSDIYYHLQYDTISTLGGDTSSETTSGETVMTTPEEMIMFSSTSSTEGILLARSRRGIYWENIYYYSFPWWYDNNGNTSLYESYTENQNELNKDNLALNGITYTGSCEKLVCIGRDHINRTGEIHPRCCFYNGDWYHHGHPMYMNNCKAQVCSEGSWVEVDHWDPYCCSNIYYELQYGTISTLGGDTYTETTSGENITTKPQEMNSFSSTSSTGGMPLPRSRRGIYWENIYNYKFPWWYDNNGNTSWYEEYSENQNELKKDNLALNGIAYTGSCEKLVCIGRDYINRTGEIHPKCCFYNGDWYHRGYPMYLNNCNAQVCSDGSWVEIDHLDPYCCSNIYYKLQYNTISTLGGYTSTETTSGENIMTTPQEMNTFSSASTTGGILLARSRHEIYWEYIVNYKFPWWYDNSGNTSWYEEYSKSENEFKKDNLALNGIAYTGSCEKLVCIGRDNINRTGVIHSRCCFYNGDWYHHGYPMYLNNCKAQVCSEGSWVEVDHFDPYCCSDIYYKIQYGIINTVGWDTYTETTSGESIMTMPQMRNTFSDTSTKGGIPLARSRRRIDWYIYEYSHKFPWWFHSNGNTSWYEEYSENQNELKKNNLVLNGIAYTDSCEELVCIGRDHIKRTGAIHPRCCFYNGSWYHHGYPMYLDNCQAQVCSEGSWIVVDHFDQNCCSDIYYKLQYSIISTVGWDTYTETTSGESIMTTPQEMNMFSDTPTTGGIPLARSRRGIDWEYINYYEFPWWYSNNGNTSWYKEYAETQNELRKYNLGLNGIAYTGSCEELVCIGRDHIKRTGAIHPRCCFYNGDWYHHGYPMYQNNCKAQVCSEGSWVEVDHFDPYCCSDIYYKLQYSTISTVGWDTSTETTSGESIMTTPQEMNTFSDTPTTGGIPLARSRRGIDWEYIYYYVYYYKFPWWYDNNGNTSWYEEYSENQNELKKNNLVLNGIAYTGSCEELVCIGRDHINRTGAIHPRCCFYNGDWYHHGYPMYQNNCKAQVCSEGSWVEVDHFDPYCCSDIYYKLQYGISSTVGWDTYTETSSGESIMTMPQKMNTFSDTSTTGGIPLARSRRGIYWEYIYYYAYYYKFPWWYDNNGNTSWYEEYAESQNELKKDNLVLNGIAYTGSCEELVCIGRDHIKRTGAIHPRCCFYNGDWYHHGYPMYLNNCKAQVCSEGSWVEVDHFDPYCCSDIYYKLQYGIISTVGWDTYTETTSGESLMSTPQKVNTFSDTSTAGGIPLARSRRGIDWEYIYYYKFPWWYDNNDNTRWYEEYSESQNELKKDNLVLNGIAYTGSCEELVCIGRDHINRTGAIHPRCCFYNGDWYHHGYPMYQNNCKAQVCSEGSWVEVDHFDPYCCSDIYYKLQYGIISTVGWDTYTETTSGENIMSMPQKMNTFSDTSTTGDVPLARSRRGIDWEYINYYEYYYKFPWWYDNNGNTSWYEEYSESQNELKKDNLVLNGIAYTGSCEELVCISRDHIKRTGAIHPRCCFYNGDWYHHGYPMYLNNCKAQVCSEGSWVEIDHFDPYCCSDIYYKLQYGIISTVGWDTYTETTSGENIMSTSQKMNTFSDTSTAGGIPLARSRRGIDWEYINYYYYEYYYKFPWWYDNNGNASWYEEYAESQNELKKDNLGLNGIAYTGSCEQLVCIGRDHIKRTGAIHPRCCFYDGSWYHHGYPIYKNDCKAQVCSEGNWVQVNHSDPYCCSDIYYKLQSGTISTVGVVTSTETTSGDNIMTTPQEMNTFSSTSTTGGILLARSRRGIYWEYIDNYKFPWWYDNNGNTSWYEEYFENQNELNKDNLPLNGITYTGSCEKLVCINKDLINRTGVINPRCCFYNGDWYHHGYPMYKEDCTAQVCSAGNWVHFKDYSDPYCCSAWNIYGVNVYSSLRDQVIWYQFRWWFNNYQWSNEYSTYSYYASLNNSIYNSRCQRLVCTGRDTLNITEEIQGDCCEYNMTWYHHGQPIYKYDCMGYVCLNGHWLETSYRDPKCCWNPDPDTDFQDSFNDLYDYYDSYQNYFKIWYKLNETRSRKGDCQEVVCASRNNWVLTGVVIPDCK